MPDSMKNHVLRKGLLCCLCLLIAHALIDPSISNAEEPAPIRFLKTWGQQGDQPGEFHFPIDIVINAQDEIYVTDHLNDRVQKFDRTGKLLAQFPVLPNPGGLALDKQGNLVISHIVASGSSKHKIGDRISIYSPQGKLIRQWGKPGKGPGEFNCPGGIAVADNGRIYVADQTNHRVQVFASSCLNGASTAVSRANSEARRSPIRGSAVRSSWPSIPRGTSGQPKAPTAASSSLQRKESCSSTGGLTPTHRADWAVISAALTVSR